MNGNYFKKKSAFSLAEIMVVLAVFTIIFLSILSVIITWQQSWDISQVKMDVQFQARRAMRRIAEELIQASPGNVIIGAGNDVITFNLPGSYGGGSINWGDNIQYSLGGLEGHQLLRTNLDKDISSPEREEILGSYISLLQFTRSDDIIQIQLTANKTFKGRSLQAQLNSQVSLRNR